MTPHRARFPIVKKPVAVKQSTVTRISRISQAVFARSDLLHSLAVVTLLGIAFAVRIWGSNFGLPALLHPDEQAIAERALAILATGDFNPHWFNYPSLYIYIQAAADIIVFLSSAEKQMESIALPTTAGYEYMQFGRAVTAILGTLTVLAVYYVGRALFSVRVGLLASAVLTFSLLHTIHSHYVTADVPMTFFMTLSLLMSAMVLRTGEGKYYLLAGLTAGLAASTKYNGGIALLSLLTAHFFVAWRQRSPVRLAAIGALPAFIAGFLVGTPYALLDLPTFLRDFAFEIAHYRSGQPGFEGNDSLLWYLRAVLDGWESVVLLFALAGAATCLTRKRAACYLLLAFPVVYLWWIGSFVVRFERNLVALTPFMALLTAVFVDWLVGKLAASRTRLRLAAPALLLGLLALASVSSLVGIVQFDTLLAAKHPKTIAAEWANSNLPRGSRIAVEFYGIPLDARSYELVNVGYIMNYGAEWFSQEKFDYAVVSDGIWSRYFLEPVKYAKEVAAYNTIFRDLELVKAVEIPPPSGRLISYPTVAVYHLPKVRIFQVEEKGQ